MNYIIIIIINFLPPPKSSLASSVDLTLIQDGRPFRKALDLDNLENRGLWTSLRYGHVPAVECSLFEPYITTRSWHYLKFGKYEGKDEQMLLINQQTENNNRTAA